MTSARGKRLVGAERAKAAAKYGKLYEKGMSIRAIATHEGTSIGRAGNLVRESGVTLRQRGGATRRTPKRGTAANKA